MSKQLTIRGQAVELRSRIFLRLPIVDMLDGTELAIPLHVVRGGGDGPVLGLFACVHGTEYYSNRIVRRILTELNLERLRGSVLAVPVANPIAFAHQTRQTPEPPEETVDFANLNRVFPGRRLTPLFGSMETTDISLTMRMASVIADEVISRCTHVIDFHGQRAPISLKKMLYNRASPTIMELARAFGLGLIHDPTGGSIGGVLTALTDYAERLGIPGIAPEIGGGGHSEAYERECERLGALGVRNVMISLGMLDGEQEVPRRQLYFRKAPHVRATRSGYLVSGMEAEDVGILKPSREVRKGEVLANIYNPYTLQEVEKIRSPTDGLIYACRTSGLVGAQSEVLAVADFDDSRWLE